MHTIGMYWEQNKENTKQPKVAQSIKNYIYCILMVALSYGINYELFLYNIWVPVIAAKVTNTT